jgi:hypothetical protein
MKDRPWQRATPPSLATPHTGPHPDDCGIARPHHDQQPAGADNDTAPTSPAGSGTTGRDRADVDAGWHATLQRLRDAAAEAGGNAVDWWEQDAIGGRATGDVQATAARVLAGIEDGDPAVLDLLPRLDEPGQQTGDLSAAERYTAATGPSDGTWAALDERRRDEATDVYRDAFDTAVLDRITNLCRQAAGTEPPQGTPSTIRPAPERLPKPGDHQ